MDFRDLKRQYKLNKSEIDAAIQNVIVQADFISGRQVKELELKLAEYVGVKHCITCANGTDALQLALMVWGIKTGDAVFVPDFTFFSSGEVVPLVGATPIFVDVEEDTYNIKPESLERAIKHVVQETDLTPRVIVAVDLFGQPADFQQLKQIADRYNLFILEDAAQGFGGRVGREKACSFGDIATTSFFPAKPLGCYGDGGAVFTDCDEWAALLKSLTVHGKGQSKYDNVRIGLNSRLDTVQAAILLAKLPVFVDRELEESNRLAGFYSERLKDLVKVPVVKDGYHSSWAQYTIQLKDESIREKVQKYLKDEGIPTMVYYQKPMHKQAAFSGFEYADEEYLVTNELCRRVLSLPFHPYLKMEEAERVVAKIGECVGG